MQKTHIERADGQKCHGVKIGEGGGVVKNTKTNGLQYSNNALRAVLLTKLT